MILAIIMVAVVNIPMMQYAAIVYKMLRKVGSPDGDSRLGTNPVRINAAIMYVNIAPTTILLFLVGDLLLSSTMYVCMPAINPLRLSVYLIDPELNLKNSQFLTLFTLKTIFIS